MPASKARVRSCTSCRQTKCDANVNFPAACTRCKQGNIDCRLDPAFKRISTRSRLDEVTSKLATLQRALETDPVTRPFTNTTRDPTRRRPESGQSLKSRDQEPSPGLSPTPDRSGCSRHPLSGSWIDSLEDDASPVDSWALANVIVTHDTARDLFRHFIEHFYRHIPILEKRPSIAAVYDTDALLFWTIVLVTCKHHPNYAGLYPQLISRYRTALGAILVKPIRSISTIHALLILCLWPGVAAPEAEDPSWHYCGLAVNSAMQMSLHHPRSPQFFDGFGVSMAVQATEEVRALTWMACFQISTTLSCFLGLPPQFSSASQLDALASLYNVLDIPRGFVALTEVQRHVARFMTVMDDVKDSKIQQSLVQHFDRELENVRDKFQDAWSPEIEFNLQSAKVYLYALCFLSDDFVLEDSYVIPNASPTAFRVLLLSGLAAAVRLIHIFSEIGTSLVSVSSDDFQAPESFVMHYPKMYFGHVFFATTYLLKYLATDLQASESDRSLARNHVTAAYQLFIRYTKSRERSRAAQVIELLGRMTKPLGRQESKLHIKDRFGASLCYDAFWQAEKMRNRAQSPAPSGGGGGPAQSSTTGLEEQRTANLAPPVDAGLITNSGQTTRDSMAVVYDHVSGQPQTERQQLPMDDGGGWEFPWGIWDDALYDELQVGQNHHDLDVNIFEDYSK